CIIFRKIFDTVEPQKSLVCLSPYSTKHKVYI
ncbi:unnamed protein product, partial [Diabrotica balteata]